MRTSVADIDQTRRECFIRSRTGRPALEPPRQAAAGTERAKNRFRTATWRQSLDDRKCREAYAVATAFWLLSLVQQIWKP
jgi:hypothetical protein